MKLYTVIASPTRMIWNDQDGCLTAGVTAGYFRCMRLVFTFWARVAKVTCLVISKARAALTVSCGLDGKTCIAAVTDAENDFQGHHVLGQYDVYYLIS